MAAKRALAVITAGMMLLFGVPGPGALAQTVEVNTATSLVGADTPLDAGGLKGPTHLTGKEGGNQKGGKFQRNGWMTRINATTYVSLSPGPNRLWGTADDGVLHCFGIGTLAQGCEFLTIGPLPLGAGDPQVEAGVRSFGNPDLDLDGDGTADDATGFEPSDQRAPLRVNFSTAVVVGAGGINASESTTIATLEVAVLCEDQTSNNAAVPGFVADDTINILRGLGGAGATVETLAGFCLGTFAADPIRVNRDTIIFAQPGADGYFHDSDACDDVGAQLDLDDQVIVVRGLFTAAAATTETLEVGGDLGVFLAGAPAGRAVRVSNGTAVIASPGDDGEFADADPAVFPGTSEAGTCGATAVTSTAEDDGLVLIQGLGEASAAAFLADFVTLGRMMAGPQGRPVRANGDPGTVVVPGTGPSHTLQEQEFIANGLIDPTTDNPDGFADEEMHVAQCLTEVCGAPVVTTLGVDLGYLDRPVRLRGGAAVVFDEDSSLAEDEESTRLRLRILSGLRSLASPALATIDVPSGDSFGPGGPEHVVRMNRNQLIFPVVGPNQVYSLTFFPGETPVLQGSGGASEDWAIVKLSRINDGAAGYTTAKQGAFGLLHLGTQTGRLIDHRLGTGGDESLTDGHGINHPASSWVRLNDGQAVVLVSGSNNDFSEQCDTFLVGPPPVCDGSGLVNLALGADDGIWVLTDLGFGERPTLQFVTTGGNCGGVGCRPLRLSGTALVLQGPGANGQFDANDDDCFNQDGTGGCDAANGGTGVVSVDDTAIFVTNIP